VTPCTYISEFDKTQLYSRLFQIRRHSAAAFGKMRCACFLHWKLLCCVVLCCVAVVVAKRRYSEVFLDVTRNSKQLCSGRDVVDRLLHLDLWLHSRQNFKRRTKNLFYDAPWLFQKFRLTSILVNVVQSA
jgi:hypothetical protein